MRRFHIVKGSQIFFERTIQNIESYDIRYFSEMVRASDGARQRGELYGEVANTLIIKNTDYQGITVEANNRIETLVDEFTDEDSTIYVHNPSRRFEIILNERSKTEIISEEYVVCSNNFSKKISNINSKIVGQERAKREIFSALNYLYQSGGSKKPYVILLYGKSSLGKTELVREIAHEFYQDKVIEKHLSMFRSNSNQDYLFGSQPTSVTLAYDILERRSNLLFLDEFDKLPDFFLSTMYTLFDNKIFQDSTYSVDISNMLIFLTANYESERDILEKVGEPIYYRIDKFVKFEDFKTSDIQKILELEVSNRQADFSSFSTIEKILEESKKVVSSHNENGRTIKKKVQEVIEREAVNSNNLF
ncbi:AAA family ATPase [Leuconostoc lactis]|uniref:AAA family ATPase n=1 Tax=Leuconostoc lactis TaxID=1246 RepID=UPI0027295ECD|nr:AAA family ATPase [Leuconostoc lactis]WKY79118.1 AAA family ATPase [Leuconostoc lactis]